MRRILTTLALWFPATALLTLVGVLAGPASPACACSCEARSQDEHLRAAEAVFVGDAVSVDNIGGAGGSLDEIRVKFRVTSVVKGRVWDVVYVHTPRDGASCGAGFQAGHRYRVYASGDVETFRSSLCSGNETLGGGGPIEQRSPTVVLLFGGGLLAVAGVGAWLVRTGKLRRR
jgi:hypothetical protein